MKTKFRERFAVPTTVCFLAVWWGAALLPGCIKEDRTDCETRMLLTIVVDRQGADEADDPDGASVFLFNADRTYLSRLEVSAGEIASGTPVEITYDTDNPLWVSVWGNLGSGEAVASPAAGDGMEQLYISMREDADGYAVGADPLYFGLKQLSGQAEEEVVITPKTGRVVVTVRGLPAESDAGRYFLTARTPYNRYDFAGNSLADETVLRFSGEFRGGDLVTDPTHLVHFPTSGDEGRAVSVDLYEYLDPSDPQLLATVETDTSGQPIVIRRGETTNILISIRPTGEIGVTVVATGWDETIEQWEEW